MGLQNSISRLGLALVACLFISFFTHADTIPRYDASSPNAFEQPFDVYIFEDKTQSLDVSAIASDQLKGYLAKSRFNIKSTDINYWFVFTIENQTSQPVRRIIRFDEPYAESADIHYLKNGEWYTEQAGLRVPVNERKISNRNPVFQISLMPDESKTVYMKLQSNYGMLTIGLLVEPPVEFVTQERLHNTAYFFYFGAIASLLVYNLFLYVCLRDKAYLFYVMHGLSYVTWVLLYSGFDLYWGVSVDVHYTLNGVTSFILLFLVLFTRSLLRTEKSFPRVDKVLKAIVLGTLVFGLLCFIDVYYYKYISYIALLTYPFLLVFGIYAVYKRVPLSVYYLSSMLLYFLGIITLTLLLVDIVSYSIFTRYFYLVGSLAELSIFSLALAYRVRLLQDQNVAYHESEIQIQTNAKNKLEIEVAARTKELSEANKALARLSKLDGLTGIGNRRMLDDWIATNYVGLKQGNGHYSIILCDIDFFKRYNDYYGHQKGDTCLRQVAKTIQASAYQPNDIVIRYGGEEFILLLPDTDELGASNVAARIQQSIHELMMEHADSEVDKYVTLSLGIATSLGNEKISIEDLILLADKRLYKAKERGRNQYCLQ